MIRIIFNLDTLAEYLRVDRVVAERWAKDKVFPKIPGRSPPAFDKADIDTWLYFGEPHKLWCWAEPRKKGRYGVDE